MRNDRDARRKALQDRLIAAASALIEERGLRGLKARDITARAECALGALYTAVEDLDQLVILVNAQSLRRLGAELNALVAKPSLPKETLQNLAKGYVNFALNNENLWSAIFHHELPVGADVPGWANAEYEGLIEKIAEPLSIMRTDLAPENLRQRAQTLFGAVHGVVQLSMMGFGVGAPRDRLAAEVAELVDTLVDGLTS